ncbi:MAG TPA: 50S ribosomal protein L28 [Pseudothermotoga sp.]|nr:50S ribosomal protein L28 [Pseudothermotoga sp.]HOK83974.1 50S ribosomal protein L28 [Pseudothermotoga sp.]HPP70957.1 50S ribosomal protein L28 [Pseudothermotoga sp.]
MAKRCEICGKEPVAGKKVSHSNRHTPRMFRPNLQKVRAVMEDGTVRTVKVCTKCLKAGKVKKVATV